MPGLADVDTCTLVRGEAAESIRVATAAAAGRLQRYRDLTNEVADSLRAGCWRRSTISTARRLGPDETAIPLDGWAIASPLGPKERSQ